MTRKLIALVTAATLAATGLAAGPAQARDRADMAAMATPAGITLVSDRHTKHHRHVSRNDHRGKGFHAPLPRRGYGYHAPTPPRGKAHGYHRHAKPAYRPHYRYWGPRGHAGARYYRR
ncbi:MAG: hypothetical protein H5U16_00210 [Roseovarius sp.]|nr:hypothetical protein [Roseovarius sp.]